MFRMFRCASTQLKRSVTARAPHWGTPVGSITGMSVVRDGTARTPLYSRSIDTNTSFALNMRIADAIMDHVEAQAKARGHNTPEEVERLREVQQRLGELVEANSALISSAVLN